MNLDIMQIVFIVSALVGGLVIGFLIAAPILRKSIESKGSLKVKEAEIAAEKIKNEKIVHSGIHTGLTH